MLPVSTSTPLLEDSDLKTLDKKFTHLPKHLETAACNVDTVLKLAAEARTVPLNEIVPLGSSKEGSQAIKCLKMVRTKFITRIMVFRVVLLPVSSRVVNALHTLLDYMEDEEVFLELAKAGEVSELCNAHAKDAHDVQKGYEYLSADLLGLSELMNTEFKKVQMDVEALMLKDQKHKETQGKLQWAAGGLATAGLATGAVLAIGLLGPGGLLFAPGFAAAAFSASCAGGGAAALAAKSASTASGAKSVAVRHSAQVLHDAHGAAQQQLPQAVVLYSKAMGHLAEFFTLFGQSIQRIERTAERIEDRLKKETELDRCYKALYKTLCKQIAEVKVSCGDYQRFVSRVNIGVNFLQLGEDRPMMSYIEEWFQEQQENGASDARHDHMHRLKDMAVKQATGAQLKLAAAGRSISRRFG